VIDAALRRRTGPRLDRAGALLARTGIRAGWLTGAGWAAGVGACAAAATRAWPVALALWLTNRACDGLDGPVARAGTGPTETGALLDIVADFSVYGGFVVAVGIAEPPARLACLALLLAYYLSGSAFLALSSLLERRGTATKDERSLRFVGGLAEGAETITVYVLFCLLPGHAALIAWAFTAAVGVTAVQRVWAGARYLAPIRRVAGMTPAQPMTVTIQYLPGCPNVALARRHVEDALRVLGGPGPRVVLQQMDDPRQAEAEGFAGSPTVLIDGVDPFPRPPGGGFTCRVYPTADGVKGAPSVEQIVTAVRQRAGG
jgi:phosphatidylglycerophosphate synthase